MEEKRTFNQDFMDLLAILSFYIGILNYDENLSQSDKDDMMAQIDNQTQTLLERLEKDLEDQNEMLQEILQRLERLDESRILQEKDL